MVYFRLAVKRPNNIKIHNNTVTTKDMYIQSISVCTHVRCLLFQQKQAIAQLS